MDIFTCLHIICPDSKVDLQQIAASSEMNLLNLPIVIGHPRRFTALDVLGLSSVGLSTKAQQTHQATRSDFLLSHSWGHGMIKGAVISLLTIFLCWV